MLLFDPLFSEPIWPIWSERGRENKGPAELTQIYEKWKGGWGGGRRGHRVYWGEGESERRGYNLQSSLG